VKINELVNSINEKDELLECQEDILIRENENFVKLKDAFAHEVEKCKNFTNELKQAMIQFPALRLRILI
jgi:hypothetical protein